MSVKLIQYWNIINGRHTDFDIFFKEKFVPQIKETGLVTAIRSWHTVSGEGPYFLTEIVSKSLEEVENLITETSFTQLRKNLFGLVYDYTTKLLIPKNDRSPKFADSEEGYKFTQHFNINAADYYAYNIFFETEIIQGIESFKLKLIGEWNVAVGATPYIVIEWHADNLTMIGEMLESVEYQKLTLKLMDLVSSYGCKILVPSGHL